MKLILYLFLWIIMINTSLAQIPGCNDPKAKNYNPNAQINDGSCEYVSSKIKPYISTLLNNTVHETSGLIYWNETFWTINDDTDINLYSFNSSGKNFKKQELKNLKNTDWEALTQDSTHFYIGDFGNNAGGNRKDLHILKIEKKSIFQDKIAIDTLFFSYENQLDFEKQKSNTTNFDCEAFVATQDSLYLFTKEWSNQETRLYALPKTSGKHLAIYKATLNVNGLITDATILEHKNCVVLSGYSKNLKPFLYILYDYNANNFFSGNKRKINVALPFHQIEAISTLDGLHYFLTNELFHRKPFITVKPQLHSVDLTPYLESYFSKNE